MRKRHYWQCDRCSPGSDLCESSSSEDGAPIFCHFSKRTTCDWKRKPRNENSYFEMVEIETEQGYVLTFDCFEGKIENVRENWCSVDLPECHGEMIDRINEIVEEENAN